MRTPRGGTEGGADRSRRLAPILDPQIARFIEMEHRQLAALVTRYGSPLNIVWPHTVTANVEAMRRVLTRHGVDHEIFYGAKVNKSRGLVRAAVGAGVGIDVSSLAELGDALRAGADPSRICATGPAKTVAFHKALIDAGSLISVDSLEELADLDGALADDRFAKKRQARVLLRLRPVSETGSRFGMDHDVVVEALHRLADRRARFAFEGLHLHLGSYAAKDRIAAMPELVALVEAASRLALPVQIIDIGGGMPIRYVEADAYELALREQGPQDYQNAKVPEYFYPYGGRQSAGDWLAEFLSGSFRSSTIAAYLRNEGLRLAIEPGRSLVDQAAISVFRVTRVKALGGGTAVIFVEGSSFSACETWFNSEFLIDPILVPTSPPDSRSGAIRAYIAGHSCLDGDIVTNRILDFSEAPRSGDLLIYANTAGYQMDLLENEFHRHPMPTRLVAGLSASGEFHFVPDT